MITIKRIDEIDKDLLWTFNVNPNKCVHPEYYSNYLKFQAKLNFQQGLAVTYFVVDEKNNRIMGFVSLKTSSLLCTSDDNVKIGSPALEISILAVDKEYENNSVGSNLVKFALAMATKLKEHVGIKYLLLCSDEKAVDFYCNKRHGFAKIDSFSDIPRENGNINCVPLFVEIK